jgi:voltage-gated potassium channel
MRVMFALAVRKNQKLMRSLSSQGLKRDLIVCIIILVVLCWLHIAAIMIFEHLSFQDSMWLTMTTISTVGYGDVAAKTIAGRAATISLLYVCGIAVMAQAATLFFAHQQSTRQRILDGKWRWHMNDHIVILNAPRHNPGAFFDSLLTDLRKSALPEAQRPLIIACPDLKHGMTDDLRRMNVAHVSDNITEKAAFENSSLKEAAVIVVLTRDEHDAFSDSITFDLVVRAREANPRATIIAETLSDANRARLLNAGADHVLRPIRTYPEMLVRTILSPGTENIVEDIFDSDGEECIRYDVRLKGKWADIATSLITKDIGMPLAYVDRDKKVVVNGRPGDHIDAQAVIVLVREGNIKSADEVLGLLGADTAVAA